MSKNKCGDVSGDCEAEKLNALLCAALRVELPEWATHVAVSKVRKDDAEPCAWVEKVNDYLDENPADIARDRWAGGYKHHYWHFFSRDELSTGQLSQRAAGVACCGDDS